MSAMVMPQLGDHRRVQRPAVREVVAGELVARHEHFPHPAGEDGPLRGRLLLGQGGPVDRRVLGLVALGQQHIEVATEPAEFLGDQLL
jgi:hypothetical protein